MRLLLPSLAFSLPLSLLAAPLGAQELVWLQNADGYSGVASAEWSSPSPEDLEAADDFTFEGPILRVIVHGDAGFYSSGVLAIDGVWIRFYDAAGGMPGALQHEVFVPEGAPGFVHDEYPSKLDVTLPVPFEASGTHFVSAQLVTPGGHGWRWRSSATSSYAGAEAHVKDELAGGAWQPYETVLGFRSDLAFELWGDDGTPPVDPVDPCGAWDLVPAPGFPETYDTVILRDVVALADDDVWAVGDPLVEVLYHDWETKTLALHWDGDEWTVVPTPNPGVMPDPYQRTSLVAVDASGPDDVWAVGNFEQQSAPWGFVVDQPLVLRWQGSVWEHLVPPSTNQDTHTHDVGVIGPDDVWLVGGIAFAPFAMHWDGSGFEQVPVDLDLPGGTPGFDLTAVDGVASDDVWAVGGGSDGDFSGTTITAHWDGSSWTYVPAPAPGSSRRLFDVHALASDDVWAVGQYEQLVGSSLKYFAFALHWDGTSWELFDGAVHPVGSLAVHGFGPDEVYSAGAQIYRWDGTSWSVADDLGQVDGQAISVSVAGLSGAEPCHLWAAGRQDVAGALMPFTARQLGPGLWSTTPVACEAAPGVPGGLLLASGPKLGTDFSVAVGDPYAISGVAPGATQTFWAVSVVGLGGCGVPVPGTGLDGAAAALLVDLAPGKLVALSGPVAWGGLGAPAEHTLPVPADPALSGLTLATQAALLDPTASSPLRLTDRLDATLGE